MATRTHIPLPNQYSDGTEETWPEVKRDGVWKNSESKVYEYKLADQWMSLHGGSAGQSLPLYLRCVTLFLKDGLCGCFA